jgi:hypothetical protein
LLAPPLPLPVAPPPLIANDSVVLQPQSTEPNVRVNALPTDAASFPAPVSTPPRSPPPSPYTPMVETPTESTSVRREQTPTLRELPQPREQVPLRRESPVKNQQREPQPPVSVEKTRVTRSGRLSRPPSRYDDYQLGYLGASTPNTDFDLLEPIAYAASASDLDTLTYEQAMSDEHRAEWVKAMCQEVDGLASMDAWEEVNISTANRKIIPVTWVFRRKRSPDGIVQTFKARLCVRTW